jgi:excisionase family DNA binding protein
MPRIAKPPAEPLTLTVDEVAALLRISRGAAYEAVRQGTIPALRLGRRILVPVAALLRLLGVDPDTPNACLRPSAGGSE